MRGKKGSAEGNARKLLDDHISMVEELLNKTLQTIEHYLNNKINEAKRNALEVDELETKADDILRSFITYLQKGAFLPIVRKDVFQIIASIDKVANAAESTCDFCLSQRPEIPEQLKTAFDDITRANVEMFPLLEKLVECLKLGTFGWAGDKDISFHEVARNIGMQESNIDDLEWKITREIFSSDLPLANKIHLHQFLNHITRISDLIEDVSDRIQMMITQEAI